MFWIGKKFFLITYFSKCMVTMVLAKIMEIDELVNLEPKNDI